MPEIMELKPSAKIPPDARRMKTSPSTDSPEIMELAVMSPYASIAVMTKISASASTADRLISSPKRKGWGTVTPPKLCTEVNHAHQPRHDVARSQADDDGTHAQVPVTASVEDQNKYQYQSGQPYVAQAAECSVGLRYCTASAGRDTHLDEAHADEGHYDARHERGDNLSCVLQQAADNHFYRSGCHARSEDQCQSARGTRSNDWADEREAGTLDAQQPRTNKAEAAALHEGGDARGDEGHGYEIARCFSIKFQCARDDEWRCDDGHEDGQQMLQRGEESFAERWAVVQTIDEAVLRRRLWLFFHISKM